MAACDAWQRQHFLWMCTMHQPCLQHSLAFMSLGSGKCWYLVLIALQLSSVYVLSKRSSARLIISWVRQSLYWKSLCRFISTSSPSAACNLSPGNRTIWPGHVLLLLNVYVLSPLRVPGAWQDPIVSKSSLHYKTTSIPASRPVSVKVVFVCDSFAKSQANSSHIGLLNNSHHSCWDHAVMEYMRSISS